MAGQTNSIPTELGTEKIGKLLKQYALPAIIAQTAASLYNMVDSIFIGQGVGPLAISGLAITFPLMNLSTAFGTLVGVGASTMLSVLLGQKNYKAANKVLGNVVTLNTIMGVVFMAAALLFLDPILYFFGASENTLPYAKEYITIILIGNVITHLYFGLNAAMRSSGNPKKAMGLTLFTVIFNTILDPIFIFVFDMGIAGAAWATVISQTIAMLAVMYHFNDRKKPLHFEKGIFRLDTRVAKDSLAIGMGPFLMNAAACLVTLFINQQLRDYSGDLGIGAYGICNRFVFMFIMICMGLNQGMQPIAGYNYGARQYSRVKEVFWKTAKLGMLMTTLCFIFGMFFPRAAVGIFTHDEQLLELA
ncbi:MAG: MATE family efflux transporter, partial [Bacteroidales bacterium]|nr:MATE family efflux transporter [Bacteroidales bacterium]